MTKRAFSGLAADHNDVLFTANGAASVANVTLQATSPASNSYVPPSGAIRWYRVEGDANFGRGTATYPPSGEVALAYLCGTFLIEATLGSGETGRIVGIAHRSSGGGGGDQLNIEWVRVANTTFNLRLTTGNPSSGGTRTTLATGSTAYNTLEKISVRLEIDGTNLTLFAAENGDVSDESSAEITHANTKLIATKKITAYATDDIDASEYIWHDSWLLIDADSTADRPDSDVTVGRLNANGEGNDQAYGDNTDCTAGSVTAVFGDVTLTTDQVVTSSFWCELGGEGGAQGADLDNFTPSKTLVGVEVWGAAEASTAAKTVTTSLRLRNVSSTLDKVNTNIGVDTFQGFVQFFDLFPSGAEWEDQTNIDAVEVAVLSNSNNGANDHWAGLIVQTYEVSDDAVVAPTFVIVTHG